MKRKSFLITSLMLLCSFVFGQNPEPHYKVGYTGQFENSMSIAAAVSFDGIEQYRTLEVGVFCNEEVRASAFTEDILGDGRYVVWINIPGKTGNVITFKVYDHQNQMEWDNECTITFHDNVDEYLSWKEGADYFDMFDPCVINFVTPPYWNPNENKYQNSFTITAIVEIDGVEQFNPNYELGAFCGDEVRGSAKTDFIYTYNGNTRYYASNMTIYGNKNDVVTFKLYDHEAKEELRLQSVNSITYIEDNYGYILDPVVINFLTPYIAKIGETKYETLQDAVDAYNGGETITMIKNAQSEDTATINKNVAIDFAGFTYDGALNLNATLNVVGTAGKVTSIVLNEGAQVYHSYALETTIVRNIARKDSGWGTLSAPTATGNVVFNTTGRHDFYKYEESANLEWVFVDVEENAYTMQPGRGYLYANKEDVVASFTGALNMDDVNYGLSCTDKETDKELSGLNMIGNPFTHNINVNHLDGEIAEAFYSVATSGAWVANVEESIAPLQAVLVQTNVAGPLAIKKAATTTRAASEGSLKINVANKNYNDVAYVLFKEGLGLSKIAHFNTEIPMVSVNVEGKEYAVATMNKEVTEIPVSFKAMTMGEYTISVEAQDVEETIYLTDKLTGERVNLNTDSYTFMATSNDNTDRFVLTKVLDTTGIEQNAEYSVYVSNDEIRFNNVNGNLNVRIYDMLGRPVAEYNVFESATISTSSFETGMYILQMTDENGVRTQKVLVD